MRLTKEPIDIIFAGGCCARTEDQTVSNRKIPIPDESDSILIPSSSNDSKQAKARKHGNSRQEFEARIGGNLPNTQKEGKVVAGEVAAQADRRRIEADREADRRVDEAKDEAKDEGKDGGKDGVKGESLREKQQKREKPRRRFAMLTRDCIKRELISC